MFKKNKKTTFILSIILFLASFLRLYSLHTIPPGLWPDEAMNANDALINPGEVFYPENNGREGLFINLIAFSFKIFGPSIFSLRLVSAVIGIFTVWGLYLLTKELFSENLALLSSFFLSVSFWHINFSRIAFRGIMLPFVLVFSFYFLFKSFKRNSVINPILAGLFFGLGFYTYSSFRLAVFIFFILLLLFWFVSKKESNKKNFLEIVSYFSLTGFFVIIPLILYFLSHPWDFWGRLKQVSIFSQDNPLKAFFISLLKHLAMFSFYGDPNWRHNLSGSPQLFWPLSLLFLIGFFISIKNLFLSWKHKNFRLFLVYCFLFSWFIFTLLPGILTIEGIPHALRTIGVIPVVFIFSGLGSDYAFEKIKKQKFFCIFSAWKHFNHFLYFLLFLFLFLLFAAEYYKYFENWAKNPLVQESFTKQFVDTGIVLNALPSGIKKYIIVNEGGVPVPYPDGISVMAQTTMFIERTKYKKLRAVYLKPEEINKIKDNQKMIIIPLRFNQDIAEKIEKIFPTTHIYEINNVKMFLINIENPEEILKNINEN